MNLLLIAAAGLLLGAPAPPARGLPIHRLDERQAGTVLVVEAGDRLVVRLHEKAGVPWRPLAPPPAPLVPLGDAVIASERDGSPYRSFTYQLRGAGEAELVFVRSGAVPARLRYRIVSR